MITEFDLNNQRKEEYDRRLERMLRNDDSDMEDYDTDGDDDFSFDVNDFFFHLFGLVLPNLSYYYPYTIYAGSMLAEEELEEDSRAEPSGDDLDDPVISDDIVIVYFSIGIMKIFVFLLDTNCSKIGQMSSSRFSRVTLY